MASPRVPVDRRWSTPSHICGDSPENETLTVETYVARQLDLLLDMDMVRRLSSDPTFREEFEFPDDEEI